MLSALLFGGCAHRALLNERDVVHASTLSPDSEQVQVRRDGVSDDEPLRELTLLKISQDCLSQGYKTFGFTSVSQPKPHLPNRPADAPVEFFGARIFDPASATLPEIQPGTLLTVKFFGQGNPAGADLMDAALTLSILTATR